MSVGGVYPNDDQIAVLLRISMPSDTKQLRSFLGNLRHYRTFPPTMASRIRLITAPLKSTLPSIFHLHH